VPARTVVIDTDPGIDDAVAILLALKSPEFRIAGITTVAGNIGIATTRRNAGRILALAGCSEIPVIAGASAPMARKGFDTADIHGNDGLGGVAFPEPTVLPLHFEPPPPLTPPLKGEGDSETVTPPSPLRGGVRGGGNDAVDWLADLLMREPKATIDILALGPLTNIALLARDHPGAASRIGRVIAMGGAIHERGNIGPRNEFNIAADPEAADLVFRAGLDLTLIPLDVTRKVRATRETTAALRASADVSARASGELIDAYFQSTAGQSTAAESRPLHDPCVMLLALRPDMFGIERLPVTVDLSHGEDAGALTIADGAPEIDVALRVEGEAALDLLVERLLAGG